MRVCVTEQLLLLEERVDSLARVSVINASDGVLPRSLIIWPRIQVRVQLEACAWMTSNRDPGCTASGDESGAYRAANEAWNLTQITDPKCGFAESLEF